MASPSLNQADFHLFEPAIPTAAPTDLRSLYEFTSTLEEPSLLWNDTGHKTIATADGLNCARAAIVAIAIEVMAALSLYGLWQLSKVLR